MGFLKVKEIIDIKNSGKEELATIEHLNSRIEQFDIKIEQSYISKLVSDIEKNAWEKRKQLFSYAVSEKEFIEEMLKVGLYDNDFSQKELKIERLKQLEDAQQDYFNLTWKNAEYNNQLKRTVEAIKNKDVTAACETLKLIDVLEKYFRDRQTNKEHKLDVVVLLINYSRDYEYERKALMAIKEIIEYDTYHIWSRIISNSSLK